MLFIGLGQQVNGLHREVDGLAGLVERQETFDFAKPTGRDLAEGSGG